MFQMAQNYATTNTPIYKGRFTLELVLLAASPIRVIHHPSGQEWHRLRLNVVLMTEPPLHLRRGLQDAGCVFPKPFKI